MFLNDLHYKISELNSESEHLMIEIYKKTADDTLLKKVAPLKRSMLEQMEHLSLSKQSIKKS